MANASRAINGRDLTLTIDGVAIQCDARSVTLNNEELETDPTFCEAKQESRQWYFDITAVQSVASTSFWRWVWANTGDTVQFVFAPEGNATPSADSPHFTGSLVVGPKPSIGGDAQSGTRVRQEFEVRFDVLGEPIMDTTP